jgi:hypothetical protein
MVLTHLPHFPIPPVLMDPAPEVTAYRGLDKRTPIVLLPVRIETRYFAGAAAGILQLRVRVYPDAAHVTTARRVPTDAELTGARAYWTANHANGSDALTTRSARERLVLAVGEARTAWLIATQTPTVGTAGALAFPAVTTSEDGADPEALALPTTFAVVGLEGTGRQFVAWGSPIAASLPIGVANTGSDGRWQVDFDAAEKAGVGIRIDLTAANAARLTHLVVLGVRDTAPPAATSLVLADLIERHATELGASLLRAGTPTNHAAGIRASARPEPATGSAPSAGSDGQRLATALGVDPAAVAHVAGAEGSSDLAARAMNQAVWPATLGYFFDEIIDPAVAVPARPAIETFFVEHVRARGPFPALCLGRQPYGVLPATSLATWRDSAGAADPPATALQGLLARWVAATASIPSITTSTDPLTTLADILAAQPTSVRWLARTVQNLVLALPGWLSGLGVTADMATIAARMAVMGDLGAATIHTEPRVHDWIFANDAADLHLPLVGSAGYIAAMAALTQVQPLVDNSIAGAQPRTLLYYLLRAATLLVMRRTAESAAAVPAADRHDVAVSAVATQPLWTRLSHVLGTAILSLPVENHRSALTTLAAQPPPELERLTAETIDLVSHRLDAWITALATRRLFDARAHGVSGSYLGAYAWLTAPAIPAQPARDGAPPAVDPTSEGHVLAPSLAHARTAAMLRAAFVARPSSEFAIGLDSRRVRAARWLLDGMREGQSLAGLLGNQIERLLLAATHGELIHQVRTDHPLASSAVGATPSPRIDGLAAHHAWQAVPPSGPLADVATTIAEMVDGIADLLLAESVHQHVIGQPDRAALVLEALEAGSVVPPDPEVVRSPVAVTRTSWRLVLSVGETGSGGWPGDARRARSIANPRVNAWVGSLLGPPAGLGATVRYESGGSAHEIAATVTDLDLGPLDLVAMAGATFDDSAIARAFAARTPAAATLVTVTASPALRRAHAVCLEVKNLVQRANPAGATDDSAAKTATDAALAQLQTDAADAAASARIAALGGPTVARATADRCTGLPPADRMLAISGLPQPGAFAATGTTTLTARSAQTQWLADLARVREPFHSLERIDLAVRRAGSRIEIAAFVQPDGTVVSVAGSPTGFGFVVDQWVEETPAREATLGLALHRPQPRARAPQAILIAVPPNPVAGWSFDALLATVVETLELARTRLARPNQVTGALLPAAYVSESLDASAISTPLADAAVHVVMEQ